jgi:GTP-binding protein
VKFIDEARITVQSGNGGSGCVSFRREKFIPRGGPDGGDGGRGGDVILRSTLRKRTLLDFQFKRNFKAKNGAPGQGNQKTGKNGDDLIIEVPPGTLVRDAETSEILKDIVSPDDSFIVAQGGRGGKGNTHFKSSTHRAPRFSQPGEPGQTLTLLLELKLLADVGIIGLPNAGKSTLIRGISSAQPKVGDYPFTTLSPSLGVVRTAWSEPFVVADIPGLIAGAHKGAGLGIQFLKHVERTRILVHLIDAAAIDATDPLRVYHILNTELAAYNEQLARKPQIVVLNKLDLEDARVLAESFKTALGQEEVLCISAMNRTGLEELLSRITCMLEYPDE